MNQIGTESAFEVLALAKGLERQGHSVVHLEIGEPDFDTPPHIKEAAIRALNEGFTHYTPAQGIYELREAIARRLERDIGVDIDPNREVIVMPGSKVCIFAAIMSIINPGDEVLVPDPGWPIYESVVRFIGGRPVPVPLREENDFKFDPEDLQEKISKKTKMVIINFPQNPCGSSLSPSDVRTVADIAGEKDLWVLSDEIYSKIVYEGGHHSMLAESDMKEHTILVDGFSKTYAMTGWRLGYAVADPEIISRMVTLQINISSCATSFAQKAAVEALNGPQDCVRDMVREYLMRRDAIVSGLNKIEGLSCQMPKGAFYVFPNTTRLGMKSKELMTLLLEKAHVATLDGTAFGQGGEGYLRLSYATSIDKIQEGLRRIDSAVQGLGRA